MRQNAPAARKGHTAVAVNGRLLLFGGGSAGSGNASTRGDANVWSWNPACEEWQALRVNAGTPPTPRHYHVAELTETGLMLVFGGQTLDGSQLLSDLHAFDTNNQAWHRISCGGDAPPPRMCHTSLYRSGRMVVFSGAGSAVESTSYEFDVNDAKWRRVDCELPCTGVSRGTTICNANTVVMFGGHTGQTFTNRVVEMQLEVPALKTLARQWLRAAGFSDAQLDAYMDGQ